MNRLSAIVFFFCLTIQITKAQVASESQEIPKILMSVNEIRDFPVQGLQNFIVTTSGVVDVQRLPSNILRFKVIGSGSTLIYIWDALGRKTIQIEVTGLATNQITTFRPGYDPAGNEFIYHMTLNNQLSNGLFNSPFWGHEFSSSVPFGKTNELRTLLKASTLDIGKAEPSQYLPFSNHTHIDQFLSYVQSRQSTWAMGDVNYNPGQLSITGFPLRGGSAEWFSVDRRKQVQVFGGRSRPRLRTNDLWNEPSEYFYGLTGASEVFPNITVKSSFVYLDQQNNTSASGVQNDYVGDVEFQARPFSDRFNIEGEFGKSKDDFASRVLLEFTPYWGRVFSSFKMVGPKYVSPSNFFLQKNFNETNFITEVKPNRKHGLIFNYQLTQLKKDPVLVVESVDVHRIQVSSLYQKNEEISYLSNALASRSVSKSSPQENQRLDFTYQRIFLKTQNQLYAQVFGQHAKTALNMQSSDRWGGGLDIRGIKKYSRSLQLYIQHSLQYNRVSGASDYSEFVSGIGPTLDYTNKKKVFSTGFYETIAFRDAFSQMSNVLSPFFSTYYNVNLALGFGARMNFNWDLTNQSNTLAAVGELIYRFGSRVPDTLFTGLVSSAHITGVVFIDENADGVYQPEEKRIDRYMVKLNDEEKVSIFQPTFFLKALAGQNKVLVELPPEWQSYQFGIANPAEFQLTSRETKTLVFPIAKRIVVHGMARLHEDESLKNNMEKGLEGVQIDISGEGFSAKVFTSLSGNFNTFVTKPGKYVATLNALELPRGYKCIGSSTVEFTVKEGEVNEVPPFAIQARRFILGRAFVDLNDNRVFDEGEKVIPGIRITVGSSTTVSEQDGTFSFTQLPAGNFKISVEPLQVKNANLVLINQQINIPEAGTLELNIPYQ